MSSLPSLFAGGLATGLLAGTGSCAAVQGGLLVGIARSPARPRPRAPEGPTDAKKPPAPGAGDPPQSSAEAGTNPPAPAGHPADDPDPAGTAAPPGTTDRTQAQPHPAPDPAVTGAPPHQSPARNDTPPGTADKTQGSPRPAPDAHGTGTPPHRGPAASDTTLGETGEVGGVGEVGEAPASTRREAGSGGRAVAVFLAGRAASHVLMGGMLGALGSAVQPPPGVRAALLVLAGIVMIAFAVGLFRRGATASTCDCTPIAARTPGVPLAKAWADGVRTWRAAGLGAATILVPCGVTLSVEVLAVATGSAIGGAIIMAGFVAGTAPGLALLGLVVRRVARGRWARAAALAALVAGVWTGVAGLRLGGWLPAPAPEAASGAQTAAVMAIPQADGSQSVDVWVTERGYRPGMLTARAGVPTRLIVHTAHTTGCLRTLTVSGHDHALPATGITPIALGPHPPSTVHFACGMGMYQGFVTFRTVP